MTRNFRSVSTNIIYLWNIRTYLAKLFEKNFWKSNWKYLTSKSN